MKTYFCKYLLEEEPVKPGDWALDLMNKELFVAGPAIQEMSEEIRSQSKKIKFVLCSRDIKVGDKYRTQYKPERELEVSKIEEGSGKDYYPKEMLVWHEEGQVELWTELSKCFKVICDISPDAYSFIQENQEFDEDEVKIMADLGFGHFTEWIEEREKLGYERIAFIKGPCDHFH